MRLVVDLTKSEDGRWCADVVNVHGASAVSATPGSATEAAVIKALARLEEYGSDGECLACGAEKVAYTS